MTKRKSHTHSSSSQIEQEFQGYSMGGQGGLEYGQNPYFQSQSTPFTFGGSPFAPHNAQVRMQNTNLGLTYDLIEEGDSLILEIPFPSLVPESLDITQNTRWIRVQGRTESPFISTEKHERRYIISQIPRGIFEQVIQLPVDVIPDQTAARFHNGVLRIELVKTVTSQNNRVSVSFK